MASLEYTAQSPYNVTPAPVQPAMPQVANNDFLQTIPFGLRSNTWRTQDAEMAKSLAKNGVDAISIYKQTGTWLSSDGKWRQEVAKGSQFQEGAGKAGIYKLPADYNLKNEVKDIALFANSFAPVTGDIQSGVMAAQDVAKGNYGSAALNAAGLLPFVPALGAITAFHGSPYRFDKFDATKIGSGEGAQAFGHGLYFAESPSVAGTYKDKLSSGVMLNDKFIDDVMINSAQDKIKKSVLMKLKNAGEVSSSPYSDVVANASKDELSYLKQIKQNLKTGSQTGSLYKVDIPDEAIPKMLDWDKRISEQPKNVQDLWNRFIKKNPEYSDPELVGSQYLNPTGEQIHGALFEKTQGMGVDARSKVAKQLKNSGITGIRYLDRDSRGHQVDLTYKGNPYPTEANKFSDIRQAQQYADEMIAKGYGANIKQTGTSNYVVFDDKLPKILERN
jgi:hypothetical protein